MLRPFAILLVAAAAGCAPTLSPVVRVNDARVLESTDAGVRLAVDLVLENPNGFPLPLERVTYRVAVLDTPLAAYAADTLPGRTLPAHGVQTLTLTAGLAGLAEREDRGLVGGLAEGLAEVMGAQARAPAEAWTADAAAGQVWQVRGDVTYAADRGLRSFLTETGVPLPRAGFQGDGRLATESPR